MNRVAIFSPDTGEFMGFEVAVKNPKNSEEYLLPPDGILEKEIGLPQPGPREAWALTESGLQIVPDHRGVSLFAKATGSRVQLPLGASPDDSVIETAPGPFEKGPWDEETSSWATDKTALATAKSALRKRIEAVRESKEAEYRSTVSVHGYDWDSGLKYLRNLERAIRVYGMAPVSMWRDATDQARPVQSVAFLEAIRDAIDADTFAAGQTLYQAKWQKKAEIEALSPSEIENYKIGTGWPW